MSPDRQEVLALGLRADGGLDPDCLEQMGQDWLADWLRHRLGGCDPWFPLDRRSDEDPETLIVGLLRGLGSGHPLALSLGSAAYSLLEEAGRTGPHLPLYFRSLLRLCQQVELPATEAWFTSEIEALAERPEDFAARWLERDLAKEILFAALWQSPGLPSSPARRAWEALLARPDSTTYALAALGSSLRQQVPYLEVWWQTCRPEERQLELSQMVFEALTAEGEEEVRRALAQAPSLPRDLQEAIDRELRSATDPLIRT